jgi:hypothetical protein
MASRSIGEIEFERGGVSLVAELHLEGWQCRHSQGQNADTADVLAESQSVLDEQLDPMGQCLTAHPAFQVEMLQRAAALLDGRVVRWPRVGSLSPGTIG